MLKPGVDSAIKTQRQEDQGDPCRGGSWGRGHDTVSDVSEVNKKVMVT